MAKTNPYQHNKEHGAKGGKVTKERHGKEHYAKIGQKGGLKGGKAVKAKYGKDYFRQIALKRWQNKDSKKGADKDGNG